MKITDMLTEKREGKTNITIDVKQTFHYKNIL